MHLILCRLPCTLPHYGSGGLLQSNQNILVCLKIRILVHILIQLLICNLFCIYITCLQG